MVFGKSPSVPGAINFTSSSSKLISGGCATECFCQKSIRLPAMARAAFVRGKLPNVLSLDGPES